MKLTNKILFVFLILLVLSVTAYKIVFDSKVELIPNPFDEKTYYVAKVFNIEDKVPDTFELKGRFIVYLIHTDTLFVRIEGPDNLINKYMSVERQGNRFSIASKIDLSKYSQFIKIFCFVNNLRSVKASGGAIISVKEFVGDSLDIMVEDSSIVKTTSCEYLNANILERDKAMVMMEKTKNATVHLYNSSNLTLTLDGGEVSGIIEAETDFGLDGIVKKNNVERVKSNSKQRGELK